MVKSRAEIQKAYRQRLKEKNHKQYLTKERERRKRTYVSNSELSRGKREQRNKKNRDYLKQYRHNKKVAEALLRNAQNPVGNETEPPSTSGYERVPSDERNRLLQVRMNFPQRANGPRMRISKELKKAKTDMKALKEKYENLKRKYRSTLRTMQRTKRKACSSPSTPRSKAARLVQHLKLTPEQGTRVQKELVFANAICDEISLSARKVPVKTKKILQNLVAGKVMRKYRVLSRLGAKTGMSRNTMAKVNSKSVEIEKIGRYRDVAKQKKKVIEFLQRDDNSRNMPGKADCVKSEDGLKTQKRVLTDYLSSLYQKFLSENPGIKLSFTSFCRIRPQYILLTSLITRDTCLCTRHQNMSMTLKAAKRQNIDTPVNGEKMLERKVEIVKDIENNITSETIVVGQWKHVQTEVKGQKKSVMKIVDSEMTKAFVKHVTSQADDFDEHVTRIKTQYKEMKRLKENLPKNHCIVHMDFSENYSCKSVQEIQSAYWNQTSVTLHPIVIYFKSTGSDEIFHKSIVVVSDEMGHNAGTVLSFIDKLIPEVKLINPATKCIHYWTDSPTSQYRNKVIFHSIASHNSIYGIEATWNYWEAGHGKGPCDGLGGTVKRMADGAVKTGKVAIQDPSDFYAWTQSTHCTMKKVQFIFVSTEYCQEKAIETAKLQLKPITGTMQLHAVKGKSQYIVAVRNTSCYCDVCIISARSTCNTWRNESIELKPKLVSKVSKPSPSDKIKEDNTASLIPISSTQESDNSVPVPSSSTARKVPQIKENYYIAAVYLENWYIGKVKDVDADDKTVEVSFLEKKKKSYQWPGKPDVIWVENSDILCKVSAPLPYGKSKRMLVLDPTDTKLVEELFNQR